MKKTLLFLFVFSFSYQLWAQSEVITKFKPLTPYPIGEVVLDRESFFQFTQSAKAAIDQFFTKEQLGQDIKILIITHPGDSSEIFIASKPQLAQPAERKLLHALKKIDAPISRISDYAFEINVQIEGGAADPYLDYQPKLLDPLEIRMKVFNELSLIMKRKALKRWVFEEVIPVLIYHLTSARENYQAVREVGNVLLSQRFMTEDIEKLTDQNPAYWQAIIELEKGNQVIPFSKACMQLAKGEFDNAIRLLVAIRLFSDKESIPFLYFEEFFQKMAAIDQELNKKIEEPLALTLQGKNKQAVKGLEQLLISLPQSARIYCELFYAQSAELKSNQAVWKLWLSSKDDVLGNDPLYPVKLKSQTAKSAYLNQRRIEAATLFQDRDQIKADFVNYADISLELGEYGFAGHLYWLISQYFREQDFDKRDMSSYFLYCLQKLGDSEVILAYEGNYLRQFEKIEMEMEKRMKKSEVYRTFKKR